MFERSRYQQADAIASQPPQPLPPDFDDLLERLAASAEARKLLQQSGLPPRD